MATEYPTPETPSDVTLKALDGTHDDATGVDYPSVGTSGEDLEKDWSQMELQKKAIAAQSSELRVVVVGDNAVGVFPGYYMFQGTRVFFEGDASKAVTASDDTYYVYIDSAGDLQVSTTDPDEPVVKLASLDVVDTVIDRDTLVDLRGYAKTRVGVGAEEISAEIADLIPTVVITVQAEGGDVIVVNLVVKNAQGDTIEEYCAFRAWLADSAGAAQTSTAPSGTVSWTTGTAIDVETAKIHWRSVMTNDSGQAALSIGEAGADTWYLHVQIGGRVYVSGAITFAA